MAFPSSYNVRGAVLIKSSQDLEMKTWQWSMVRPTKLRLYYMYSEVRQQIKENKCGNKSES